MKVKTKGFGGFLLLIVNCLLPTVSSAAHPLITDDTGTQGTGKLLLEINVETSYDQEQENGTAIKETGSEMAAIFSYGLHANLDVVVGLPYRWNKARENSEVVSDEDGVSDMSLEVKWMFYEKDGLSLALKPGIARSIGDDEKGPGTGRMTYSLFFISTKEMEPFAFHLNISYIRNENKGAERNDIWHASLATELKIIKNLRSVANIGIENNPDQASPADPAFILGGLIYSVSENVDIDFGIKAGLNQPETDRTLLAGVALKF